MIPSYRQEDFTDNIVADVTYFHDQRNEFRVLIFPPLCSFNRFLIHKAIEVNFSELITFSIGSGRSRRTVVAFRKTLERAGTDLQLMSEQTLPPSKSHGRGRGKNMTPNERVAQWVNQREKRQINKERWSNKDQIKSFSEGKTEDSMDTFHDAEDTGEECTKDEKSKSRRTPQAQLYIPPSLRKLKDQEVLFNDDCEQSPTLTPQRNVADSTERIKETISKPQNTHRAKGRGRGRKPEMEVYVPRALRATQKQTKEVASSRSCENKSDSKSMDQNGVNCSNFNQSSNESEISDSAEYNSNYNIPDLSSRDSNKISSPNVPDFEKVPEVTNESTEISDCPNSNEVFHDPTYSEDPNASFDSNYTFEFYDPAVVAFMPPSPVTKDFDAVHYSMPEKQADNSFSSPLDQHHSIKEGNVLACSENLEMPTPELSVGIISSTQVNNSVSGASSVHQEPEINAKERDCDNNSVYISETVLVKATDLTSHREAATCELQANQCIEVEPRQKPTSSLVAEEESTEDSWDTMFDDNGDCLDESLMDELTKIVGKVEVTKPTINYLKYEPKEPDMDMHSLGHVIEIYDFSPELATHDIISAFRDFASRGFDVKWVDDTHALGVFSNAISANEALQMMHPLLKTRPMSQAAKQSQSKARHCQEFLQPYKARPETTSIAAHRLVAGALGMAPRVSREMRDKERQKLKEAKEKRRQEKQQKIDIWDGNFGKCAMDDV